MTIGTLEGKNLCILGFGREGRAMLDAIRIYAPHATVTVADANTALELPDGVAAQTGENWLKDLDRFDVLIVSPGIPPTPAIEQAGVLITNSTDIFLETVQAAGCTVVGITGSKGKSTTSSLIHAMLREAGIPSLLVGNIGEPAIAHLPDARNGLIFVMEMSSYQLMRCTVSPHIAVVTSFFPEHLDYHGNLAAYLDAKQHITRFQTAQDIVLFCAESTGCASIAAESSGRIIPFQAADCPVAATKLQLIGEHNRTNVAGAAMAASLLGASDAAIYQGAIKFQGLPHRLQSLGVYAGYEWVDDAISTTPDSAIAALDALDNRVASIILGGRDRGVCLLPIASRLAASSVQRIVLFGENSPQLMEALTQYGLQDRAVQADSMEEAVRLASVKPADASHNPIILLSPAAAGYDRFANFERKGEAFAKAIQTLAHTTKQKVVARGSTQE